MKKLESLINKWGKLLYYYQRFGKWPKEDLIDGTLLAFRIQIFNLLMYLYVPFLGFVKGNFYTTLLPYIVINFFITKIIVDKKISNLVKINIKQYSLSYEKDTFIKKIINFLIVLIITIAIVLGFILSFKILNWKIFK